MARAFVAVGSNIEPEANLRRALRLLGQRHRPVAVSTVYRTPPLGRPEQPDYLNCVVEVETEAEPEELKQELRRIEQELGRVRGADRYAARTIDLDLIAYEGMQVRTPDLVLPDPEIGGRPFVALPLAELAPDLALPGIGGDAAAVAARFTGDDMAPLTEYTESLRGELRHG